MPADGPITFRDHFASIFQSALTEVGARISSASTISIRTRGSSGGDIAREDEEYAKVAAQLMAERLGVEPAQQMEIRRTRSLISATKACAEVALRYMDARLNGSPDQIARIEDEFKAGSCDPAWFSTVNEYLEYFGPRGTRREVPYITPALAGDRSVQIPRSARVALVADWGTGAGPAVAIMKQVAALKPDVVIHLGDVYYSGTPTEYQLNFIDVLDTAFEGKRPPTFILSGNHDMYCGGAGYYSAIASLNSGSSKQKASFFCLRTEDEAWQLLAMDTGLNDFKPLEVQDNVTSLRDDEAEWLLRRIEEFQGKTILLSHHQLFSAFSQIGSSGSMSSPCNPHLLQWFSEANSKGHIAAWFWGHEHSLSIYEPYAGLARGRCIGHGAIPVMSTEKIYTELPALKRPPKIIAGTKLATDGHVFAHGFAFLRMGPSDEAATAEYYQSISGRAEPLYSEQIK